MELQLLTVSHDEQMYWFEVSYERIIADLLLYKQHTYKVMKEP